MGTPLREDDRHSTYADYLTWDDDQRWEPIEGVAHAMAPTPAIQHQDIVGGFFSQAWFALNGKPDIQAMEGTTTLAVLPEVVIDWAPIVALLPAQRP